MYTIPTYTEVNQTLLEEQEGGGSFVMTKRLLLEFEVVTMELE
jgi:hypothetical protein